MLWLGQVSPAHWPVALPPAVLGEPAESPTCGAGELPEQFRFDPAELVTTSFPSGSKVTLSLKLMLCVTALRMNPSQHVPSPVTDALPSMVLSSYVLKAGGPLGPSGKVLQLTPPPPPDCVTLPPMVLWCASTISAPVAERLPPTWSLVEALGSLRHGNASGSQPTTKIACDPTVRLPPTFRSDPPNAASRAAPWATVRFLVTVTGPASTEQNPVTVSDWYVPAATEPPEQVAFPLAADAATGSNGRATPAAPAASRAASLPLNRGNRLIMNPPALVRP